MEEKKNQDAAKKLSYEELSKAASELHVQYQKLLNEYQRAMGALQDRSFEKASFFLQALFRVMDHPEFYKEEFVEWCTKYIEAALHSFAEDSEASAEEESKAKDEAE